MTENTYLLSYDVGTTGMKSCLYSCAKELHLVASAMEKYPLHIREGGGAEQDPQDWYNAMSVTTALILKESKVEASQIKGISFCSQMQALVLVDEEGKAVRNAFSYLDQRAGEELREGIARGLTVAGANVVKLLVSLAITRAVALSVKDPVWKYQWVKKHESDHFSRVHKWLDAKEYLIGRLTGAFVMTEDSAFATLLLDAKKRVWSPTMCRMLKVDMRHLPTIIRSTDEVGPLSSEAAAFLGLPQGIPVFGGGGDAAVIGLGAGAVRNQDSHIYIGTSGWLGTVVEKNLVDPATMSAAIVSAVSGQYNYFSELETAGKCLEWVKDHLALDEINLYLEKTLVTDSPEAVATNLYEYLTTVIQTAHPEATGSSSPRGCTATASLRGSECTRHVLQHQPGDGQDRDDPQCHRRHLHAYALVPRSPGEEDEDQRSHPLRRWRGALTGDLPDPERCPWTEDPDHRRPPECRRTGGSHAGCPRLGHLPQRGGSDHGDSVGGAL